MKYWKATLAGAIFGLLLFGFTLRPGECVGWKGYVQMCGSQR
jgi:hypothetical protein